MQWLLQEHQQVGQQSILKLGHPALKKKELHLIQLFSKLEKQFLPLSTDMAAVWIFTVDSFLGRPVSTYVWQLNLCSSCGCPTSLGQVSSWIVIIIKLHSNIIRRVSDFNSSCGVCTRSQHWWFGFFFNRCCNWVTGIMFWNYNCWGLIFNFDFFFYIAGGPTTSSTFNPHFALDKIPMEHIHTINECLTRFYAYCYTMHN